MPKSAPRRVAIVLLTATFCIVLYRAWNQSFVHDEAFMWDRYLAVPAAEIFQRFAAENHFLHTVLAKLAQLAFGNSPFALRLPSVFAAALFFYTIYRLMFGAAGETWMATVGVALLALNPAILDFWIACRGYGLALALFTVGVAAVVRYFSEESMPRAELAKAGAATALAVTANLTFAIPAIAVSTILASLVLIDRADKRKPATLLHFAVSAALIAIVFVLVSPVRHARKRHFFVGAHSALQSLWNMVDIAIRHNSTVWIDNWRNPPAGNMWTKVVSLAIVPLIFAAFAMGCVKLYRIVKSGGVRGLNTRQMLMVVSGTVLVISSALLIALHQMTGLLYPIERTGLYMQLLIGLVVVSIPSAFPRSAFGNAWLILPAAFVVLFASQLETSYFPVWRYDADTRAMLDRIPVSKTPVRLGISWEFEPVINYYRRTSPLPWIAPVDRSGPNGEYDFYMLTPWDQTLVNERSLRVRSRGAASQAVFATAR